MRRWAWGLGVVLALAVVLALVWPDTSSERPDSRTSPTTRADARRRGPGKVPGEGASPAAPSAPTRGDGSIRGVVLSLIGQPVPGVSIVALAVPAEGTFLWGGTCRAVGTAAQACDSDFAPLGDTLEAVQSRVPVLLRTTSDAEGHFALTGLEPGLYEVWAEAPHGVAVHKVATGTAGTRFVLEEGTRPEGFIRDEENGPIAGASVVLLPRELLRHFETFSGADGRFSFGRVPAGTYWVLGGRDGLLPDMDVLISQTRRELSLTLQAPHVITGRVVRQGRGVPGMRVQARGLWDEPPVLTDGQGHFTFDGVRLGEYTVAAYEGSEGAVVTTQVEGAEPARVLLELQPCAVLEGGVTDGSGAPLPEAEVTFQLFEGPAEFGRRTRTDAGGHYRFDCLLPGSFEATARAKGFRSRVLGSGERLLAVGETRRMDFQLAEAAPFDGFVVDTEGQPIPGARVLMYWDADVHPSEEQPAETVDVLTGEDGRFSADGLAPGRYGVIVSVGSEEEFESFHEQVQVPGTGARFVLVRAPPTPGVIVGTVVDERGQPLPGVHIEAQPHPASQQEFSTRTNELGQFRLEKLPLASWSILATHGGSQFGAQVRATAEVEVRGPEPLLVTLQLADGLSVSGRVVDGQGAPVFFALVSASQRLPASEESLLADAAETDAEGRFTLRHLSPGEHVVEVLAREPDSPLAPSRTLVRAGDTDVRVVLGLLPQVHGRVVHADGRPVTTFLVNGRSFSDADGRFSLPVSSTGPLLLTFTAEGLAPTPRRLEAPGQSDVVLPDVTMVRGPAVRSDSLP